MELGMQPPNSLFARTTTEAGELPRFAGMGSRNLFEFKKIASKGRLNSSLGIGPSNSLNRRSRYFNDGIASKGLGNEPTNRLLLKSSSCKR
ncbi:hypothetical protein FCM35_KLT10456 [Carex littledalei]|uniref:Uncharacterized protein n=1 Tax=Carex littledalei TaxID=544730 RepID=A0A833QI10_9POAL|nr:hypothetical protein FCM35_KLT10456 [Carex littledalei]